MKFCKKCVQPDTRPNIVFGDDGVCLACTLIAEHLKTDWKKRRVEAERIVEYGKKHNVSGYDCIVGVSGGKDSMRQSLYVRDELGMNPLLVCCTYPPEQATERGRKNLSTLVEFGFDCMVISPDPQIWKRLMKVGFEEHGNWVKSTDLAIYASAISAAISYQIPVVFYGENDAMYLGSDDMGSTGGDANGMKYCNTVQGGDPKYLMKDGMTHQDMYWYRYPSDDDMDLAKLRLVFLGFYIEDFTNFGNAEFSIARGLITRGQPSEEIGDLFGNSALDDDFVVVNQMLKYLKFGFGKVTDQVCEMVRYGRMTREEAVEAVKKYDGKCHDKYITRFCEFLGITKEHFWEVAETYRNHDLWEKDEKGEWKLKFELV